MRVFGVGLLLLVASGCSSDSSSPVATDRKASEVKRPAPEPTAPRVEHRIASSYKAGGRDWKIIVVKQGLSDSELLTLARELHRMYSGVSMHVFDDDAQVEAYERWTVNYPSPDYPFPERWAKRHHVGMLNRMFEAGGPRWQLFGGDAHPTSPQTRIADLE